MLESIKIVKAGSLVLDVGCSESLLSHELVARGSRVVGLDIRDYPFRNKYIRFLRRNVMYTCLPANLFDAIIISTIEHVGFGGDIEKVEEIGYGLRLYKWESCKVYDVLANADAIVPPQLML